MLQIGPTSGESAEAQEAWVGLGNAHELNALRDFTDSADLTYKPL
jgi:hypothetical protein